jgi:phage terminase small subunit
LAKIGFSDIRKIVKWQSAMVTEEDSPDGGEKLVVKNIVTNLVQIIGSDEVDDVTAACISEISQTDKGAVKVKLHDKRAALVDLGRHQLGSCSSPRNLPKSVEGAPTHTINIES